MITLVQETYKREVPPKALPFCPIYENFQIFLQVRRTVKQDTSSGRSTLVKGYGQVRHLPFQDIQVLVPEPRLLFLINHLFLARYLFDGHGSPYKGTGHIHILYQGMQPVFDILTSILILDVIV